MDQYGGIKLASFYEQKLTAMPYGAPVMVCYIYYYANLIVAASLSENFFAIRVDFSND